MNSEELDIAAHERRWHLFWLTLPYALFGIAAIWTLKHVVSDPVLTAQGMGICAAIMGWYYLWVTRHPDWAETKAVPMLVHYAGFIVLFWFVVGVVESASVIFIAACIVAFTTLPGLLAYGGVAVIAVIPAIEAASRGHPDALTILLINVAAGAGGAVVGGVFRWAERETRKRTEAYRELKALAHRNEILSAQTARDAKRIGAANERARLAREFHDTLAQGLAGISAQLDVASEQLREHPAAERVTIARQQANECLRETRRSLQALRPSLLDDQDLGASLSDLVESWNQRNHATARFIIDGVPDSCEISRDGEVALVRAAGEALANVARHSEATQAVVTLTMTPHEVMLDVVDNGIGFTPSEVGDRSFGLEAMRERLEENAGSVAIDSRPGQGTTVSVYLPTTVPEVEREPGHVSS